MYLKVTGQYVGSTQAGDKASSFGLSGTIICLAVGGAASATPRHLVVIALRPTAAFATDLQRHNAHPNTAGFSPTTFSQPYPLGRLRVTLLYTPIRCKLSSNQHPRRQSVSTSSKTMADSGNAPKPSSSVKLVLLGEAAVGKVDLILSRRHPALLHYANSRASVLVGPSIRQQRLPGEQGAHYWRSVDPSSTEQ